MKSIRSESFKSRYLVKTHNYKESQIQDPIKRKLDPHTNASLSKESTLKFNLLSCYGGDKL